MTALEMLDRRIEEARIKLDHAREVVLEGEAFLRGLEVGRELAAGEAQPPPRKRLSFDEAMDALGDEFTREQLEALPGFGEKRAGEFVDKLVGSGQLDTTETGFRFCGPADKAER